MKRISRARKTAWKCAAQKGLFILLGLFLTLSWPTFAVCAKPGSDLTLHLRTCIQPFKAVDSTEEIVITEHYPAQETAILICDMWDKHWCSNANARCDALAKKMAPLLQAARLRGALIIHAPSECMDFYKESIQRQRILKAPQVAPPQSIEITDPPLPVDSSDGGCDDVPSAKSYKAWTREHPAILIGEEDVISDKGTEIYSYLRLRHIKVLLIMGVHTNMCICNRSFGIRQMTKWGIPCVLVRDLTDAMYNPKMKPYVSHAKGTALVIQHIEKYWCPSMESSDLLIIAQP